MNTVNWDAFEALAGSPESNFETLCRALIRRHYGRFGDFVARAAQPGVEFHLRLRTDCSLGEAGRWFGWQCRWYQLQSGRALGGSRRAKIQEALSLTQSELPGLTDWVLWTRYPLTKGDQAWFYELTTSLRLHLWTHHEVEEHLTGDAEILRRTYFGDLILTSDVLEKLHNVAVAPIRARWIPQVHYTTEAEESLRRVLIEQEAWEVLRIQAEQLKIDVETVNADMADVEGTKPDDELVPLLKQAKFLTDVAVAVRGTLEAYATGLYGGEFDHFKQDIANRKPVDLHVFQDLPRRFRSRRHPVALSVTNLLADTTEGLRRLSESEQLFSKQLIAVVGSAGGGKTQLAAQVTAGGGDRPAGIFLRGGALSASGSLDTLASTIVVFGSPVSSMEALLAALDAAGRRAHRRLPLAIDGLNESEDPRIWKSLLHTLDSLIIDYPYVLAVCTLRPSFVQECLPDNINRLILQGFGSGTFTAVRKYFAYYRINPGDADIPVELLQDPLVLRLFCEVANRPRQKEVGLESLPFSLTALFERYLEQAAERIAELAPKAHRYYQADIRAAVYEIGTLLWEGRTRALDLKTLRAHLKDDIRPWDQSLIHALEQEEVLLRAAGETGSTTTLSFLYDALSGHVIAEALLQQKGRDIFAKYISDPEAATLLFGSDVSRHPFHNDIVRAIVGLFPRRHSQQLWPLLQGPERRVALRLAADLEGPYLDADTVEALAAMLVDSAEEDEELFGRLRQTRATVSHPLNADFLDRVLRKLDVSQRDFRWAEWLRRKRDTVIGDIEYQERRWTARIDRPPSDYLRAKWVMWTLTSTVRELRDKATRALYWYGRGGPELLFDLSLGSLSINDPYVPERVLAATCGVVMAKQQPDLLFSKTLGALLERLLGFLCGPEAIYPTSHWLSRLYVQLMVTMAQAYHPDAVPKRFVEGGAVQFAPGPAVAPIPEDDPRSAEISNILSMDFSNYTLGRLTRGRRNYDFGHKGHSDAVAFVKGVAWALGWRENALGIVDRHMGYSSRYTDGDRTERYGKKYGWIGFYSYAGVLEDARRCPQARLSDISIDPSFPAEPDRAALALPDWTRSGPSADDIWIRSGAVGLPQDFFCTKTLLAYPGEWLLVDGFLRQESKAVQREVFGFILGVLVAPNDVERLVDAFQKREYPGNDWLPNAPSDYYTFAGEFPWSPEFGRTYAEDSDEAEGMYNRSIEVEAGMPVPVEILSHEFSWEGYHSVTNQAGNVLVPSKAFSTFVGLRGSAQTFNQAMPDGSVGSISLKAPAGFTGQLLYLRADLLARYARDRKLVLFMWGERNVHTDWNNRPEWLEHVYTDHAHIWRVIPAEKGKSSRTRKGLKLKAVRKTGSRVLSGPNDVS